MRVQLAILSMAQQQLKQKKSLEGCSTVQFLLICRCHFLLVLYEALGLLKRFLLGKQHIPPGHACMCFSAHLSVTYMCTRLVKMLYCTCHKRGMTILLLLLLLQELDYKEFKMFAMACIDRQMEIEQRKKGQSERADDEEGEKEGRGWCSLQ